ncbi:MAG: preprotein translocase subunit YajC [Muribaculaceae bacterium]|nr:preprotein translocase subunit YajC [Muribaculaceae bacterium]
MNSMLLLQSENPGGGFSGMIMIIAMIVIFYFFMIRPQSKKQKEIKKAREAMQKGDSVVTAGGIHGKIKEISDNTILMEISPGVSIKVDKASVFPAGQQEPMQKEGNK